MPTLSEKPLLSEGTILGDYELQAVSHEGKEAAVYSAKHIRFRRKAAIKVLKIQLDRSGDAADRFRDYAITLSTLRSDHVAEVYDFGILEDGRPYLVQEWVEGRPLGTADNAALTLSRGKLLRVLQGIATGLDALALAKLQHGKLCTANVLLDRKSDAPKLIGLSLTQVIESASDSEHASHDLHDFGVLMQQVIAGQSDLKARTATTRRNSAVDSSEPKVSLEAQVKKIIDRCLTSASPYASAADAVRELAAILDLGEAAIESKKGLPRGTLVAGTYRIEGVLGKGGMGTVYEATHTRLPQRVAIKVISGNFSKDSLKRFRREAEISSSLGHPHIVRVFDFNTLEDGTPYMVMDFLEGRDLSKVLKKGPISTERCLRITGHIASALSAVHEKGIIHRDLKPPNVFLRKIETGGKVREHATVLDFGVSKREDADTLLTKSRALLGTPRYMAPEQAMGENKRVSALSDQFALACLVYEMLSGAPAFGKGKLAEVVYSVCHVDPPPLDEVVEEIPASIASVVARGMSKQPEDRYATVAQFAAALSGGGDTQAEKESEAAPSAPVRVKDIESPGFTTEVLESPEPEMPPSPVAGPAPSKKPYHLYLYGAALVALLAVLALANALRSTESTGGEMESVVVFVADASAPRVGIGKQPGGPFDASPPPPDAASPSNGNAGAGAETDAALTRKERMADAASSGPVPVAKDPLSSPETRATLKKARALLDEGRYQETRDLITRTGQAAKTATGVSLIVMSYCGEGRFGPAQDWLRRVPRNGRRAVRRYCKSEHEVDLD